jgi:choline dehydrogenase-like flavoprotein
MGDFQVKKQSKNYDAIIVGSGAGGGMAAYVLSKAGLKICLIEAGPMYDPAKNITQLKNPWDSPRRGASTKFRPFGDFDACYWGWDIEECWEEEQITGEEFLFVSAPKILKEKASMDLVTTGR